MKRKLALGNQEFSKVIGKNCIYVDKTKYIYRMIEEGDYYFLSRPRRFGKSLLANTLKELFKGNKKLFKGLWIYDKWDWEKTYPVIKMSFSRMSYYELGLEKAIDNELTDIASENDISLTKKTNGDKFEELIKNLSKKEQVAIIIDEYDKPIIDYLEDFDKAEENRKILKNFYSVLKDLDNYIKFFFVTGVSKFSRVSIFSDLNNLDDITIDDRYSQIVGWTKEEIEEYFPEYIKEVAEVYKDIYPDIMPKIKKWYNGYSWDGKNFVYNPWSVMSLFGKREFSNYWFKTGSPSFLMELIKERNFTAFVMQNREVPMLMFDKYEINSMTLEPLLFQTGYFTILSKNLRNQTATIGFPNFEVEEAFSYFLLSKLTIDQTDRTSIFLIDMIKSFKDNKIENFIKYVNVLFKNVSYSIIEEKENYYHSLFFMIIKIIGFDIEVEIETIDGRIDAAIKTDDNIYVVEFKINQSAKKAIKQIKEKKYALKYANNKRPISLLGINFDTEKKTIEDYLLEKY